ncbi:polysaccharide deacetylase family protein [Paenibacillus chartarius]|uniref:Polysaccharide deacetylase family protein n=1 Tax=Paenibacillus chartarius TaxID=747481 RepID=A0ABV6DJI4_9BACL
MKPSWHWLGIGLICAVLALSLPTSTVGGIWYEDQVAVIAYHHIDKVVQQGGVTITPELFERQLTDLKHRGYRFITMRQFRKYLDGGQVPPNAVLVTFDDGYYSFYRYAYPILTKLDIPAVNFIITDTLKDPAADQLRFLSRDEIREMMAANKGIEFGCHSSGLHAKTKDGDPYLTTRFRREDGEESDEQYEARIVRDTRSCVAALKELGSGIADMYAYPFGSYDDNSIRLLNDAGIQYAFTVHSEMVTRSTNPMEIPRLNAGSPYMKPVSVNNHILRKVAARIEASDLVPLTAVKQIGGTVKPFANGEVEITYENKNYRILADRKTVVAGEDSYYLSHPIRFQDKRNYIRNDDLERMLDVKLAYNPLKDIYMRAETPHKRSKTGH